jgi:hypothetical protein
LEVSFSRYVLYGWSKDEKDQQNEWDGLLPKQLNINILLIQGLHRAEGNNDFFIR